MTDVKPTDTVKLYQSVSVIIILGMGTYSATIGVVSGDALIGLFGAAVGYIFGDSTSRRDARQAADHALLQVEHRLATNEPEGHK